MLDVEAAVRAERCGVDELDGVRGETVIEPLRDIAHAPRAGRRDTTGADVDRGRRAALVGEAAMVAARFFGPKGAGDVDLARFRIVLEDAHQKPSGRSDAHTWLDRDAAGRAGARCGGRKRRPVRGLGAVVTIGEPRNDLVGQQVAQPLERAEYRIGASRRCSGRSARVRCAREAGHRCDGFFVSESAHDGGPEFVASVNMFVAATPAVLNRP
jgi:hypothetical protein